MFTREKIVLSEDPFTYGYFDDILEDPTPLEYFPSWDKMHYMEGKKNIDMDDKHYKWHLNETHDGFLDALGPWAGLYDWLQDGGFHDWALDMFGLDGMKEGRMEFSCLPNDGGRMRAHTDSGHKYMSLIIFCSGYPQGFDAGPTKEGPWARVEFVPNRLAFFVRNDESWHKVGPIDPATADYPNQTRNTITLNLLKQDVTKKK